MPLNLYMGIAIIVMISVLFLDQLSKYLVIKNMYIGQSIEVLGNFFKIHYIENDGAAFSSFSGMKVILIGIPIVVLTIATIYMIKNIKKSVFQNISLSLVISGGIGNLIDRIAKASVTDMFSFSIFPPIFNVADIAVTVGCAMILLYVLFFENPEKGNSSGKRKN